MMRTKLELNSGALRAVGLWRAVFAVLIGAVGSQPAAVAQCIAPPGPGDWTPIGPKLTTIFAHERDGINTNELYVGTFFGGIYKSSDFGLSWCHIPTEFSNDVVFAIDLVETTPRTIYVGTQDRGVFRTIDGALSWEQRNTGLPAESIRDVLVDPFDDQHVLACTFSGVYETTDGGDSWQLSLTDAPFLPAVAAVFDPVEQGTAYVITQGLGIHKSTDGGSSWQEFNENLAPTSSMTSIAWDVNNPDRLIATSSAAVYVLIRGESRWRNVTRNLPDSARIQNVSTLHGDEQIYVATDSGIFRLELSTDQTNERPFLNAQQSKRRGAVKSFTKPLQSDADRWVRWSEQRSRFIFNNPEASLIHVVYLLNFFEVSADGGNSFFPADTGMQNLFCGALATINANGSTAIYVGTGNDIRVTSDFFSTELFAWSPQINLFGAIFEITPDRNTEGVLYAGTEGSGVYKTTDFGGVWARQDNGIVPPLLNAIAESVGPDPTLYAGTSSGIYISTDEGATWQSRAQNQNPRIITDVEAHPAFADFAYYATDDGTVFRSIDAGREFFPVWSTPNGEGIKQLEVAPFAEHYAVGESGTVYVSYDDGANFFPSGVGMILEPATSIVINEERPWISYVGTIFGGVYRSESNGIEWEARAQGMQVPIVFSLAMDPDDWDTVYAGGIGRIYKTIDEGLNWTAMTDGLPAASNVIAIEVDPNNTSVLYATLRDEDNELLEEPLVEGIFKSTDAGLSWVRLTDPTDFDPTAALLASKATAGNVYVGSNLTGFYKSEDSGQTFSRSINGMSLVILSIVVDHSNSQTVFACSVKSGLFKSSDAGTTWRNVGLRGVTIFHVTMDPTDPNILFASTSRGPYVSRDAGETWALSGQDTPYVFSLISDPANPDRVFIGSADGTFYRSEDGGRSWSLPEIELPKLDVNSLAIDPVDDILYAGLSRFDMGTNTSRFFRSRNGGKTWFEGDSALFADERIITVTVDPTQGDLYLASYSEVSGGRLFKSVDTGISWSELPVNAGADFISSIAVLPLADSMSAVYISILNDQSPGAGPVVPLRRSLDGGDTWEDANTGVGEVDASHVVFASQGIGGTLFAVTGGNEIYSSSDLGENWAQVGTIGNSTTVFAIVPVSATELYAGTDSGVYRSIDAGMTWVSTSALLDEPVQPTPHRIAIGTSGAYAGTFDRGVFFSEDQGATWLGGISQEHSVMVPHAMAVDPADPNRVFAATGNQGIALSDDGGVSWAFTNTGLGAQVMFTITIDSANPNRIYASSQDNGVWISTDAGASWSDLNGGLFNEFVTAFTLDANDPNVIYAGTEGGGVFRLEQE